MNKYSLILFDLDGTLCDTDEMIVQSWFALYEEYEPKIRRTREELYYFSGPSIYDMCREEFPNYDTNEVVEAFRRISKNLYEPYVKAYADEIDVLKSLKANGYLLGINTNKNRKLSIKSLEVAGIDFDLFDILISSDEANKPKPDPNGVFKAMDILSITDKNKVLYVGDNDIDYYTAKNADVHSMLVTWGPRKLKCLKQATYNVNSYNEIGELLL